MEKTYWLAVYKTGEDNPFLRIGAITFESEEECKIMANRENYVKAVAITFNTDTGNLIRIGE